MSRKRRVRIKGGIQGEVQEFRRRIRGTDILVSIPKDGVKKIDYSNRPYTDKKCADLKLSMNGPLVLTVDELDSLIKDLEELKNWI